MTCPSPWSLLGLTCLALVGCSPESAGLTSTTNDTGGNGNGGDGHGGAGANGGDGHGGAGETGGTGGGGQVVPGTVGMVVIDVQETFVDIAANTDIADIIGRTKSAFQLAQDNDLPFFITFEDSQQGDHSLHPPLKPALPVHAKDFTKTTYGATGLPAFAGAVKEAGLSHLVVLGAETDVCVLQTVLGLRKLGFTVMLQQDAVFTSETNTSPALRRMQQAGTLLVTESAVAQYVAKPSELPKGGDQTVTITEPLHLGVVLNAFTDATLAGNDDPLTAQKSARLRELLLVSEWFDLPVYVPNVGAGLPADFETYYQGQLRPITQIEQDSFVTQLVFAGTDADLSTALSTWMKSRDVFVMEDALLAAGTPAAQKTMLAPFFEQGLVPTTYKSFYYDMTKSVDLAQWPSQQWVAKYDEYYWITQAPEDLPPMPGN